MKKNHWLILNNLDILTIVATANRPGTDFLHSLLDNHPEIISFDGWLYFHEFFYKSISIFGTKNHFFNNLNDEFNNINLSNFFYEFAWSHLHKFDSRYDNLELKGNLGVNKDDFNLLNIDEFVKTAVNLISDEEFSSRNAMLAIYGSIALVRGDDLTNKKVLLHNVHLPEHLDLLVEDFPDVKIIACTRDPRVLATKINKTLDGMSLSSYSVNMSRALFKLNIDGINPLSSRNLNVRINSLERLHVKPLEVMTNICNWIGVKYSDSLLHSTWNGKIWNGDILSDDIEVFFDPGRYTESKRKWKRDMYITERIVIESIMKKEINTYKYTHDFNTKYWFLLVPFFIILPTKYEVHIFSQIFKRRKFHLIIYLAINVLYRYYRSYKKLLDNFGKNPVHFPIL
jgi:hypothetical protein